MHPFSFGVTLDSLFVQVSYISVYQYILYSFTYCQCVCTACITMHLQYMCIQLCLCACTLYPPYQSTDCQYVVGGTTMDPDPAAMLIYKLLQLNCLALYWQSIDSLLGTSPPDDWMVYFVEYILTFIEYAQSTALCVCLCRVVCVCVFVFVCVRVCVCVSGGLKRRYC